MRWFGLLGLCNNVLSKARGVNADWRHLVCWLHIGGATAKSHIGILQVDELLLPQEAHTMQMVWRLKT